MLELKIGKKPVRPYVTAVIVHLKTGGTDVVIKARGQNVSKAVDVAEIVKRFQETPMELTDIKIGTEEFLVNRETNKTVEENAKVSEEDIKYFRVRRVSFIEITLKLKKIRDMVGIEKA